MQPDFLRMVRSALTLVVFVFLLLTVTACLKARGDTQDVYDATCRITAPDGSSGSGTVCEIGTDYVQVLTAAHVIGKAGGPCYLDFWRAGHESPRMTGQVLASDPSIDTAMVVVPLSAFGSVRPRAIPLGAAGDDPQPGQTICSAGSANGAWLTQWQGHVLRTDKQRMWFVPPPSGGRSGAAITNADGTRIIGVLQVRSADGEGGATLASAIRARMDGQIAQAKEVFVPRAEVLCQQCPGGSCPIPRQPSRQIGILNGGIQIGGRNQTGPAPGNPWQAAPTPVLPAPSVDLKPIQDELRRIEDRRPVAPAAPAPDPRVDQALQAAGQAQQRIDGLTGEVSKLTGTVQEVGEAVKPIVKIKERLEADVEAGGIKGRIAQRILDRFEGEDGGLNKTHTILICAGVAAALLFVAGLVHWLRTGHGLVAEAMLRASQRHPENESLAKHAKALAAAEEALRATLPAGKALLAAEAGKDMLAQFQHLKDYIEARLKPAPGQPEKPASPPN